MDENVKVVNTSMALSKNITMTVRWFDGYLEKFDCIDYRHGGYILWMKLSNGKERIIPLIQVRWFGSNEGSHNN